ncbi:MAG: TolC family protein [bacterium]
MKYLSKSVSIIVILLLAFSSVYAQSNPLTLKECIQIALDNSSKIATAKRSLDTAQLEVKDARAGYLPGLGISAGYNINDTYDKIEWTEKHYDARLSLTETFYDNGQTSAKIEQAKARLTSAQLDFQKIQDDLVLEVIKNYYTLLKAQGMLKVKEEGLKQAQTHLNLAKARYDAGSVPKSDILKAEVEVSGAELDSIEAENTLSLARADLNNCLGIDLNTPILIVDIEEPLMISGDTKKKAASSNPEPRTPNPEIDMTLDECLSYALKNRPEIKKAEINLKINEINLKLAQKEVWPSIALEGSYNTDIDQLINKYDWDESTGWEIGIKASLPIFDAGKAKRGVTKAKLNLANTKTNADQLKKEIALEVKKAYLTAKSQKKVIETTEKQLSQAKESFESTQGRYSSGVAPIYEVTDAQASLNNARTNYVRAIYDYQIAIFTLKKVIGGEIL